VDRRVVERFASAIQAGAIDDLTALLAEDVWGVIDGGGVVVTANKPTFGRRAVSRQWANAKARLGLPVLAEVRSVNGELAIHVRLAAAPAVLVAVVCLETRAGAVSALRVLRDPARLSRVGAR
jgi:ketosteroid isomerase-like protein